MSKKVLFCFLHKDLIWFRAFLLTHASSKGLDQMISNVHSNINSSINVAELKGGLDSFLLSSAQAMKEPISAVEWN